MKFFENFVQAKSSSYDEEYVRRVSFIRNLIPDEFHGRILDIGCFKGTLSTKIRGAKYFGLDKIDCFEGSGEFTKFNLDLGYLPYPNKFFRCIVCTDVLEHIGCPDNILYEIKRVLEDGGFVIISLPNERGLKGFIQRHFIIPSSWIEQKDFYHLWYFDISIAREFVLQVFDIIEEFSYSGRILGKIPILGSSKRLCSSWFMVCRKKNV